MDNQQFTDVMVDLETTGTHPDRTAILQIGAVKYNLLTGAVSPQVFNRSLRVPGWRGWDEDTREWWGKQPQVLYDIVARAEDPQIVMNDFVQWAMKPGGQLNFWAKPTSFDFSFVSSYLRDYDLPQPFSYRDATDMNSFLKGLYYPNPVDREDEPKMIGTAHNALADALFQTKIVFHHTNRAMALRNA